MMTYWRSFDLYNKSFFETLPFAVAYTIATGLINTWLAFADNFAGFDFFFFKYVFIHVSIFIIFYIMALNAVWQVHANKDTDIIEIMQVTVIRFIPSIAPFIFTICILAMTIFLSIGLLAILPNDFGVILWFVVILVAISFLIIITFAVRMCFTPLLIGVIGMDLLQAIKESDRLITGRRFFTVTLFLPLIIIKGILSTVFTNLGVCYQETVNVVIMPFSACLLMTYYFQFSTKSHLLKQGG